MSRLSLWRRIALVAVLFTSGAALAQSDAAFRCGGRLETDVWQLWDRSAHDFLRSEMMVKRLKAVGDTYALYDVQVYAQNLAAMAARCGRIDRLQELAALIDMAFQEMQPLPNQPTKFGKGWICRGGRVCNATNKLIDTEIGLNSQQFLAFAMRVASALAALPDWPANRPFVERTVVATTYHLQRWTSGKDPLRLAERLKARAEDVRDGQSRLFFTDQDLWIIDIAAELAGMLAARPDLRPPLPNNGLAGAPRDAVVGLLELLKARTTTVPLESKSLGRLVGADIDRGFWRLYRDSRYAGYSGAKKPVECSPGKPAQAAVPPEEVKIVSTIGWDFSHARRLVHLMDALERNRAALQKVFDVPDPLMPSPDLPRQFAAEMAAAVWTGDREYPLFANYWDGTNGWYRVAYDNGTNTCVEGYPPSGLSDSFTTGGFVVWARHYAVIGELGERIYRLSRSEDDAKARDFIATYYSQLDAKASANNRMLTQLMFWPSLVQWSPKP